MPRKTAVVKPGSPASISDLDLRKFVEVIAAGDASLVSRMLVASPRLAQANFHEGATRQAPKPNFLDTIKRYIWTGDTAQHFAAAAYQTEIARKLLAAGADVRARNRLGAEPLHSAAV